MTFHKKYNPYAQKHGWELVDECFTVFVILFYWIIGVEQYVSLELMVRIKKAVLHMFIIYLHKSIISIKYHIITLLENVRKFWLSFP